MNAPYTLVTDPAEFAALCRDLPRAGRIAVDTEADSMHHYPERVCLVQIATPAATYVVDPIALRDLSPLAVAMASPAVRKVMHGADYDIRGLHRDWGLVVTNLFDSYVAARFLGLERVGLAALLLDLLGVDIPKDRKLQRADWQKRPLSDDALLYAASDVEHLFALEDELADRLERLGRTAWVQEEFARLCEVRHTPPDLQAAALAMPESRKLDGRRLAVLHALYCYREAEARRLDRPPFHVLSNEAIGAIAAAPETPLEKQPGMGPNAVRRFGKGVRDCVREALSGPPLLRPAPALPPRPRPTPAQARRLAALRAWRTGEAKSLEMEVSLVWPMRSLERLARNPASLPEEIASPDVRAWQRDRFLPALRRALSD